MNDQPSGKFRLRAMLFAALLFLILLPSVILHSGNALSIEQMRQINSDNNIKCIAHFTLQYEQAHHGKMPKTMKDVAEYSDGLFDYFYPPIPGFSTPPDSLTNIDVIDARAGYCLVHASNFTIPTEGVGYSTKAYNSTHPPNTKILVYEKPSLWPDATVAIGLSDLTVMRLSSKDFEALKLQ